MSDDKKDQYTAGTLFVTGKLEADIYPEIGGKSIAAILSAFNKETVYFRYVLDNRPITPETFVDLLIHTELGEVWASCDWTPAYSEVTPGGYDERGFVGDHNILATFGSSKARYAAILISTKPIADLTETLGLL